MGVEKKGVLRRWPLVQLSAYGRVHKQNFHCIKKLLGKNISNFIPSYLKPQQALAFEMVSNTN